MTVDLKRDKLEAEIKDGPATSADGILITLDQLYKEAVDKQVAVSADDEVAKEDDCEPDEETHEDGAAPVMQKDKKPHEKMGEDITYLGRQQLMDKDIIQMRLEKERISKEKCMLRSCIVNYLEKASEVETVKI